jgi:hypothetical protein
MKLKNKLTLLKKLVLNRTVLSVFMNPFMINRKKIFILSWRDVNVIYLKSSIN